MPEITHGNLKVYYESHGQGDALILIRGLGSNADHWYPQLEDLSRQFRVITFDNRGIARSGDPGGAFTIKDMAADTIGLMDALGIEGAHILGVSMGGMIAQEMAINHPQRIRGLILAVTHCGGKRQIAADERIRRKLQRMVAEGSLEARADAVDAFFARQTIEERPQVVQAFAKVSMTHLAGPAILQRQLGAVAGHDTYERLGQINAPTLVLAAQKDALIPPENSNTLAAGIPKAELLVVPGGGHQILIEQPEACNQAIIAFLQKWGSEFDTGSQ